MHGQARRNGGAVVAAIVGLTSGNIAAAAERSLAVTIYNGDLALVQDRRDIELTGGRQRLEFEDVSAQIRPRDRLSRRARHQHHRAEFRLRSADSR